MNIDDTRCSDREVWTRATINGILHDIDMKTKELLSTGYSYEEYRDQVVAILADAYATLERLGS